MSLEIGKDTNTVNVSILENLRTHIFRSIK
jgi:hypothetical protein